MKPGFKLGIVSMAVVLVLIALIQAAQKTPVDWHPTYSPKDKIPYGTYILKHELKTIFPQNHSVTDIDEPVYTYFSDTDPDPEDDFIFIGDTFDIGRAALGKLLTFVHSGHTAFISAHAVPPSLCDTLGIKIAAFDNYEASVPYKNDSTWLSLARFGKRVYYDRIHSARVFSDLAKQTRILGYFHREAVSVPDFIAVSVGKGTLYLHLEPEVFTNYYLLQKEPYAIAVNALRYIKGMRILWYDGQFNLDQEATPLRFILSRPALRWGWYILLFALVVFLLFKSKREQRPVPVIPPEPNLSVTFAETIGSLYYENGNPGNMVLKKIAYFLFLLRQQFHLDTGNLSDDGFRYALGQRVGMNPQEVASFLDILAAYQNRDGWTEEDLKYIHNVIEQFKQKANLL